MSVLFLKTRPEAEAVLIDLLRKAPFDQIQSQPRVEQVFAADPERKACIAIVEDTILAKLEWYRMRGEVTDRQWRDILGILRVQDGRLDLDYLQKCASELNVADLLQRALKESQ
jgi:hypothetical protein